MSRRLDVLTAAAAAFLAANLLHGVDHQRQGTDRLTAEIWIGGTVLTIGAVVALVYVLRRHRRAPLVAAVVGLWSATAVVASHLAPHWSAFSDPYPELSPDAVSWAVMLAEVGTALALGLAGARLARRRSAGGEGAVGWGA